MDLMKCLNLMLIWILVCLDSSSSDETLNNADNYAGVQDFCMFDTFKPECRKSEVVFVNSAIYGRMRIGKCITSEDMAAFGQHVADDPRYLGCSTDVRSLLDRRCSGETACEIRLSDSLFENIKPCLPGLNVYLEVSYDCIDVADEKRSCTLQVTKTPTNIIVSSVSEGICGSDSQPWNIQATSGQRIRIILYEFMSLASDQTQEGSRFPCRKYGVVVDRANRRNVSICGANSGRESEILLIFGNAVTITFTPVTEQKFMLKLEAVGCSDVIPPADTWLKRNGDLIIIGCYSSRQTWHLKCQEGKWVGVLGNCSQVDIQESIEPNNSERHPISEDEQVLAIVAISGCTLAICLAIVCIGAICLRRLYNQIKKRQTFNTVNYSKASTEKLLYRNQLISTGMRTDATGSINTSSGVVTDQEPTYSVYVAEN